MFVFCDALSASCLRKAQYIYIKKNTACLQFLFVTLAKHSAVKKVLAPFPISNLNWIKIE